MPFSKCAHPIAFPMSRCLSSCNPTTRFSIFQADGNPTGSCGYVWQLYLGITRPQWSTRWHLLGRAYISGQDYPQILTREKPFVSIPRGQFALLLTKEHVKIPKNYLAFISIRLALKRQGLVNMSGFHVDPGFEGRLYFSVFNAGPADVVLEHNTACFMIFFYKMHSNVSNPYDNPEKQGQTRLPPSLVTSLKGTSASLSDVDKRVGRLEATARIYTAFLIAGAAAILALFVSVIA